jgi:hypothetical protein
MWAMLIQLLSLDMDRDFTLIPIDTFSIRGRGSRELSRDRAGCCLKMEVCMRANSRKDRLRELERGLGAMAQFIWASF